MRLGCAGSLLRYAVQARPNRDPFEAQLEEAARLGLAGLNVQIERWAAPPHVGRLAGRAAAAGIRIEPNWADRFADPDPAAVRPPDAFGEWLDTLCIPFGVRVVGHYVIGAHRFLRPPPLDEQLDLIAERLRPLADIAAARGIRLAIENHADYRGPELLTIVKQVGRPNFGVRLDTGNPLTIGEEPLEAARVLAPYTFTTHLKDLHVFPVGRRDGPRVPHLTGAQLGTGVVGLAEIVALLATHAPDAADLPLNVEIDWQPPETDARTWAEASIRYCREQFGSYLAAGGRPASAAPAIGAHA